MVRARYGEAAQRAACGEGGGCGSGCGCGGSTAADPITSGRYLESETTVLPQEAVLACLGCGNPTALAELRAGEVVLDLGSGVGIDVLLSARRVGPTGRAYGLDMTDEMLELARANATHAGTTNVEFLKGEIENIPLSDDSVDVVISNCVINTLCRQEDRPERSVSRAEARGGRFAVSYVVVRGRLPAVVRRSLELWVGCLAGALEEAEFRSLLEEVGFERVEIGPTRVCRMEDARGFLEDAGVGDHPAVAQVDGQLMAAFVRGVKPAVQRTGR